MEPIKSGTTAPPIPGVQANGPRAVVFYKVTCPTCQMAAPPLGEFARTYDGHVVGIGQDPPEKLGAFEQAYDMRLGSVSDAPPYDLSNAYGVRTVPTTFLLDGDGTVMDVVESWDRDGLNALAGRLAEMIGSPYRSVSEPSDGLPPFRPG